MPPVATRFASRTSFHGSPRAWAWSERGVRVSVAEYRLFQQRRPDHLSEMLGARGLVEEELAWGSIVGEDHFADLLGDRASARLARDDHAPFEPRGNRADEGALARALRFPRR